MRWLTIMVTGVGLALSALGWPGESRAQQPIASITSTTRAGDVGESESVAQTSAQADQVITNLGGDIWLLPGAPGPATKGNMARTGNIAAIAGRTGVFVWNSGVSYLHGQQVVAKILDAVDKPIRLVAISHAYQDVLFGWQAFTEIGISMWMHRGAYKLMKRRCATCLRNLQELLGESAMFGTALAEPTRIIESGERNTDLIGRDLEILDFGFSSGPNDLAVFDHETGTLFAGALVFTDRLFEIRDGRQKGWIAALNQLKTMPIKRVVPDYGQPGDMNDVVRTHDYLTMLADKAAELLKARVGLSAVVEQGQLPAYSKLHGYEDAHARNIHQMYLDLEKNFFE